MTYPRDPATYQRFPGRTAIVTGGSRSIGAAIAVALAAEGANIVVNYRTDAAAAQQVVTRIERAGGSAAAVRADVSDPEQAARLVATAGGDVRTGRPAGEQRRRPHAYPVLRIEPAEWERVLATNLSGAFYCAQAAARVMVQRGSGAIDNVTSINDRRARTDLTHYMNRDRPADESVRASYEELIPLGEIGQPADVVEPVLFLLSPAARLVTGSALVIDGGRSLI